MVDPITSDDLADEHAELLPNREVLSLLTDPTAGVPSLLGPPQTAGAGDLAGGMTGDASHLAGSAAAHHDSAGTTYSPTQSASAG